MLIAIRAPQIDADGLNHTFIQVYVAGYVLISLFFFVYAIMALRPRVGRMHRMGEARAKGGLPGLRLMDDILATRYRRLLRAVAHGRSRSARSEMALQAYLLARANAEKFQAVRRVYHGLLLLVGLTAVLVAIIGLHVMMPERQGSNENSAESLDKAFRVSVSPRFVAAREVTCSQRLTPHTKLAASSRLPDPL